jgi:hypothetical protein
VGGKPHSEKSGDFAMQQLQQFARTLIRRGAAAERKQVIFSIVGSDHRGQRPRLQ